MTFKVGGGEKNPLKKQKETKQKKHFFLVKDKDACSLTEVSARTVSSARCYAVHLTLLWGACIFLDI